MDYRLVKAYELREDFLVGNIPIYWDRSERVTFDVVQEHSKSGAAVERFEHQIQKAMKPDSTPRFGLRYYASPRTVDGGPLPTMEEYLKEKKAKAGTKEPGSPVTHSADPRKRGLKPNAGWAGAH